MRVLPKYTGLLWMDESDVLIRQLSSKVYAAASSFIAEYRPYISRVGGKSRCGVCFDRGLVSYILVKAIFPHTATRNTVQEKLPKKCGEYTLEARCLSQEEAKKNKRPVPTLLEE